MTHNTPQTWNNLLENKGEAAAFYGGTQEDYWASGERIWEYIAPMMEPFGECPCLMEWGAGTGRILLAAVNALGLRPQYWAYEPSEAARRMFKTQVPTHDLPVFLLGPDDLSQATFGYTHIFCYNTAQHMTYDDLWEFFGFVSGHIAPGGVLLFDYVPTYSDKGRALLASKDGSEWPAYAWAPERIAALMEVQAPAMHLQRERDTGRRIDTWRRT